MARKHPTKVADTVDLLKPYLERALRDEDFRHDLKDAMQAARELYGPLARTGSVKASAKTLATDRKTQDQLLRALEDITNAAGTLQGKERPRKGRKGRKALLFAGVVAGALYNPWTGSQTRDRLLDLLAGSDALEPVDGFEPVGAHANGGGTVDEPDTGEL